MRRRRPPAAARLRTGRLVLLAPLVLLALLVLREARASQVRGHRFGRHPHLVGGPTAGAAHHLGAPRPPPPPAPLSVAGGLSAARPSGPAATPQVPIERPEQPEAGRVAAHSQPASDREPHQLRAAPTDSLATPLARLHAHARTSDIWRARPSAGAGRAQSPPEPADAHPPLTVGAQVEARFRLRPATIIQAKESLDAGAAFLNYTIVSRLGACLIECWITELCDTAVFQEAPIELGPASTATIKPPPGPRADGFFLCYLFQCNSSATQQSCHFAPHNHYTSSTLRRPAPGDPPTRGCSRDQFTCRSGACIPSELVCDGRTNCADRTDELGCARLHEAPATPFTPSPAPVYSRLVQSNHRLALRRGQQTAWRDSHLASIRFGHEEPDDLVHASWMGAIIAASLGLAATSLIIFIVSHKMSSIRDRMASKTRRRSLVPDVDYLLNTIPI